MEKTIAAVRQRFYWPTLAADVQQWCSVCPQCVHRKKPSAGRVPLMSIQTSYPLEMVSMNFLSLELSVSGYQKILVITDHVSKYSWAAATRDQTANTTARMLWHHVVQPFGCPARFHSDQGPNFEAAVVQRLCDLYGVKKSHSTPYHPEGNGLSERFNRTLLNLLGTLVGDKKSHWSEFLPEVVHAYNNTVHGSTGYSPFYLMFGRHARAPIDIMLGRPLTEEPVMVEDWVQEHHNRLQYAY